MPSSAGMLSVLIVLLVVCPASADVVELRTGQRVEGRFQQATAAGVVIDVNGQVMTFGLDQVRAIHFEATAAPTMQSSTREEALGVLKELEASTRGKLQYRDYAQKVAAAKHVVDRYLREPIAGDAELKNIIGEAMAFHALAAAAWESRLTNSVSASVAIGQDPMLERCPALRKVVAEYPSPDTRESAFRRGVAIEFEISKVWSCAGDSLAAAERLLAR